MTPSLSSTPLLLFFICPAITLWECAKKAGDEKSAFWQQCQWMKLRLDWTTLFFFPPSSIFFYLSSSPPFLCLIWFWCFFSFFLLSVHHLLCSFSIPPLQREGSTSGPIPVRIWCWWAELGKVASVARGSETCASKFPWVRERVYYSSGNLCVKVTEAIWVFMVIGHPFFAPYMGVTFICINVFSLNSDSVVGAACGLCDLINKISF